MSRNKVVVKATGHIIQTDDAKTATYKTSGLTEGSHCSSCNEILVDQKLIPVKTLVSPVVKAVNTTDGIKLSWQSVKGAEGYVVYRGDTRIKTIKGSDIVNYTDTNATTNGGKYRYSVKAYAGSLKINSSKDAKITAVRMKQPVISKTSYTKKGGMSISWTENKKASGYEIKLTNGSSVRIIKVSGGSITSKRIKKLTKGARYRIYVRSYKEVSGKTYYSSWSAAKTVKTV